MKARYAATFEFESAAPVTVRGEVSGTGLQTLVFRAAVKAKAQAPKMAWSSFVIVLLERIGED